MATTLFDAEREAIEEAFRTGWAGATEIQLENVTFQQPDADPWVALWILRGQGEQRTLGRTALLKWAGVVQVDVNVPHRYGKGTSGPLELVATASSIFERAQLTTDDGARLFFRIPWVESTERRGEWHTTTMRVRYDRYLQKTVT